MFIILTWLALSVAVGMFAHIRRDRDGFGWGLLALIISSLLAGIFVAILKEKSRRIVITKYRSSDIFTENGYAPGSEAERFRSSHDRQQLRYSELKVR